MNMEEEMNNFERVKSMSIQEMAHWLANEIPHGDCYGCGLCDLGNTCEDSWFKILKNKYQCIR